MRADNDGEGGIMALTRARPARLGERASRRTATLVTLGVLGASLFYGDSVITPAISVLSAVEGLKVAAPSLAPSCCRSRSTMLVGLFLIQRWGTASRRRRCSGR